MKEIVAVIILMFVLITEAQAQKSEPSELTPYFVTERINFDGIPSEPFWQKAMQVSNFTQRDPDFGQPVTEPTKVAVAYNRNNLFVAVWCYTKDKSGIAAKFMETDFNYESDDNFQIMISPFEDNRTGYLFVINPNGARADIQISGGEDGNGDWNGVWDARAVITDSGWFAEVVIPFNTLQFKSDSVLNWALNFERDIAQKNEQALWQGWSRDNSIFAVVRAGRLINLKNIAYAKRFELKPYGLAGLHYDDADGTSDILKAGGDLNVYLSPTLKLNLTTFTDFAQVESDRIPVNLSRFSVYYPEKRQFFLEGYDLYSFYLGDRNTAFYTREIGIENGKQVPILAGARLFGKVGKHNIGFLNIQEGAVDTIPSTNNTVFRYTHNIGKQSYVGGIFTNVVNKDHSNQVLGLDASYQSSEFLGDKNISVSGRFAMSFDDVASQSQSFTYRLSVDYPNDLIDNFMAFGTMRRNFNPELGYLRRTDYNSYSWHLRITPRWLTNYGIRKFLFKPWGFTLYQTQTTGEIESFRNETRPLGAVFKTGDRFEVNFIQSYDRLDNPFGLTDSLVIPTGKYMMYKYELQLETYQGRRLFAFLLLNRGGFYTGTITTFEGVLGVNVTKHFNVNANYTRNYVDLPQGSIITNEVATYLKYAFNTRLNLTLFGQFNDLDQVMIYNIRLHWIPRIGSDLYFVYNIGYDDPVKEVELLKPHTTDAVVKLVWRFVF